MPNLKTTATVTLAGLIGAAGTVIAAPLVDGTRGSGDNYGSVPVATQGVSVIDIVNGEPVDISITSDQSNDGGVGPYGAGTFDFPAPDSDPASVATGFEVAIDLDELGWDGSSPIRIAGWVANGGHNTMSNQVIGGLPAATGNFDDVTVVDFNTVPGNQYVTVPSSGSAAPTVDGTLDASYGSALFARHGWPRPSPATPTRPMWLRTVRRSTRCTRTTTATGCTCSWRATCARALRN